MNGEWLERCCPLCGSSAGGPVFAESNIDLSGLDGFAFASRKLPEYMHPRLIECSGCGMLYGNPVLSPEALARAYQAADFDSGREAYYAGITYAAHLRRILRRLPGLRGALDIGTGDGAFLEQLLRLGFQDVMGVEPSEAPVSAAKPEIKPLIRNSVFQADDFSPGSLALVSSFQTLEHVPHPLETARGAYQLLKKGGVFLIVVHNRKSVSARLLGMKSPIFDVEHLQLFCPATCEQLLARAGFTDIRVSPLWNRYPLHYWAKLFPLPDGIKRPLLKALQRSVAGKIPIPLPAGNLICYGFK